MDMRGRVGRVRKVAVGPMLATVGLLGVTAAVVGGLAFATFTSTTSASQDVGSGNVAFASLTPSGTGQRLSVAATDIAPGDTIQRAVTLTNTGSIDMDTSAVRLTTSATTSSLLDSGANGLTMAIDKCSVAWTESAFPYTYTCGGTTTSVLASSPVIVANAALANIDTAPATPNHLRVTLTLPTAADNTYQNQSSVISYSFAGTQRAGTDR
jgi:hypothetical protein